MALLLCPSELDRSESTYLLEESTSPFIDEGDGLTSERESVCMLTKSCCPHRWVQDDGRCLQYYLMLYARGRLCRLLQVWQMSVPATLLIPRGMQGVLPCSPDMVNAGTHKTVDALEACGGALPYLSGMGVDGTHNTIGKNVGTYNTAWVLT